jgi:hypothetical protein
VCAAAVERLGAETPAGAVEGPRENYEARGTPEMFPYAHGEGRSREEEESKTY